MKWLGFLLIWESGTPSSLKKLSDKVLTWLSVWSEVQMTSTWSHWLSLTSHHLLFHQNPEWCQLAQLILEKMPLNEY